MKTHPSHPTARPGRFLGHMGGEAGRRVPAWTTLRTRASDPGKPGLSLLGTGRGCGGPCAPG